MVLFGDSTISKLLWIRREYLAHIKFLFNLRLLLFNFVLEPGVSVNCSDIITVTLEKRTFPFFDVARLHLRYSSCKATQNDTHLLVSTPLNGCGTLVNETNEGSADNDGSGGEDIAEQDMWTRPQRQRRPPQILTYNSLGNPQYQSAEPVFSSSRVNAIQTPAITAIHPGIPLYFWVWPCCFQPVYYPRA